ncbi:MAG: GntR family transcriptional regulator [Pyrinomonadaceae bacterium]|nr:GntR family transcriptional regulator [Pyrinomonadaceae bacterium]
MREQIIAQISIGIVSRDLSAGEKLPSTRELARRFQIHPNTVSAAYRELAEQNLVEFKKGSGVYVRENGSGVNGFDALDQIINRFFQEAAAHNFSPDEIKARLQKRFEAKSPTHFLVVESDSELRKILIEEVRAATDRTVDSVSFEEFAKSGVDDEAQIALIFDRMPDAHQILPPNKTCIFLKANSVADSMTGKARPSDDDLIAVVSGWKKFLELAKMFLLAARVAPETLVVRSANETNWRNGLQTVSLIICDLATAKEFPNDERVRVFRLIADSSLDKLRESIG